VAQAAHALGVGGARLKWPNDVLVAERKLAGVLCEVRRAPGGSDPGAGSGEAVVIGVGLNVGHAREEFPEELRATATSLALEGSTARLEDAAAEFLNRLEPLWALLQQGNRAAVLAEWSRWGAHWGEPVHVRTPAGAVEGIAQRLDPDGGLVLRVDTGAETVVLAGDLVAPPEGRPAA
jgi:BirA family biotin operon repressor/biotin-[acetyl-CoA-carboxylase] ligase